jgi:hypothetical protein
VKSLLEKGFAEVVTQPVLVRHPVHRNCSIPNMCRVTVKTVDEYDPYEALMKLVFFSVLRHGALEK